MLAPGFELRSLDYIELKASARLLLEFSAPEITLQYIALKFYLKFMTFKIINKVHCNYIENKLRVPTTSLCTISYGILNANKLLFKLFNFALGTPSFYSLSR